MSSSRLGLPIRFLAAAVTVMGVVCPAMVSANEIRILFVASGDVGVAAQVRRLERALRESQGPLAIAESPSEAHVVVQLTEYRRSIGAKGEPLFHWVGHAKLLKQPEEMTVSAVPLPEQFELLVAGEDGREQRALKLLELMLSKTLRPRARKPVKEAI